MICEDSGFDATCITLDVRSKDGASEHTGASYAVAPTGIRMDSVYLDAAQNPSCKDASSAAGCIHIPFASSLMPFTTLDVA